MKHEEEVIKILNAVLNIEAGRQAVGPETQLFGALPEFDSMTVVAVVEALEDHFGFVAEDEELTEKTFLNVGNLVNYVQSKLTS